MYEKKETRLFKRTCCFSIHGDRCQDLYQDVLLGTPAPRMWFKFFEPKFIQFLCKYGFHMDEKQSKDIVFMEVDPLKRKNVIESILYMFLLYHCKHKESRTCMDVIGCGLIIYLNSSGDAVTKNISDLLRLNFNCNHSNYEALFNMVITNFKFTQGMTLEVL